MSEYEDSLERNAVREAFERRSDEDEAAYARRLSGYADKALGAFRAAAGETLQPSDLIHCLLHWCDQNGFTAGGSINGARMQYAFDQGHGLAEWDERTWHTKPDLKVTDGRRQFSMTKDQTGMVILAIADPPALSATRIVIDRQQARKVVQWLGGWLLKQSVSKLST